jgi:hypothetical protein
MTADNFCFYLQNRLIQTSQTGGQQYIDASPFSIPWLDSNHRPWDDVASVKPLCHHRWPAHYFSMTFLLLSLILSVVATKTFFKFSRQP